jgi:NAD(P)-dependent dehydrogenase (short-subunit alcohol dehydrogenase family)
MNATGRAVIVTGGGTGCGRAICARFASLGSHVVVADINEVKGQETAELLKREGGSAVFRTADMRVEMQIRELIEFAEQTFGGVHILVNNASAPHGGPEMESWMDALQTDFFGAMYATRYATEAMRRGGGGAIVNIASISALWHGRTTLGGIPGYDVAKAAMIRMTTRLASLAETDRIRVNCLAPGWIATDNVRPHWEPLTPQERAARSMPSRLLSTDQIADTVVRLALDESLAGRVVLWWSEGMPRLIAWGDRGYEKYEPF